MPADPPSHARLTLPAWLWNGNPEKLLHECQYKIRNDKDRYLVQPEERYLRRKADFVRTKSISSPGSVPRFHLLSELEEKFDIPMPDGIERELKSRFEKAESTKGLLELLNHQRLALFAVGREGLPSRAEFLVNLLRDMPSAENAEVHPFEDAGLDIVEVGRTLVQRLKLPSIWLRIEQDPRLQGGDTSHLLTVGESEHAFGASFGLYTGIYMFDAYLAPLLGALSPGVWGVVVPKTLGLMVFSFGRCVAGTGNDAAEMLQLVSTPGADEVTPMVSLLPGASSSAVTWWVERLNQLFGVLSDLAVFTDENGNYRAAKHLESLLTIEQVFRRTTSMQVAHRDSNARRTLMFSVIDSLVRTNGWNLDTMFSLSHAQKVLAGLEEAIPEDAATVLLPMARQAVTSLERMQNGFFIQRQLFSEKVELRLGSDGTKEFTPQDAAAMYLKVLRNATHGHGGKGKETQITAALLAHHTGEVPHDIGLLAYLYLLDMLINPERVRRCFYRSGR